MRISRIVLGIVLVAHGIGHTLGVLAPSLGDDSWSLGSWLLPDATPDWTGMAAFAVVAIMFVLAGLAAMGLLVREHNLRWLTEIAAVLSLISLALWWDALPTIWSKVAAIVIDLVVIAGALPERRLRQVQKTVGPAPA